MYTKRSRVKWTLVSSGQWNDSDLVNRWLGSDGSLVIAAPFIDRQILAFMSSKMSQQDFAGLTYASYRRCMGLGFRNKSGLWESVPGHTFEEAILSDEFQTLFSAYLDWDGRSSAIENNRADLALLSKALREAR